MEASECSATIENINSFLLEYKSKLENGIEFVHRTYDGITNLGLNIEMAREELLTLTYHNYDRGPTKDYNGDNTDIWEFGKMIEEELVYIKIKIQNEKCKVISFKASDGPFTLPFKNW